MLCYEAQREVSIRQPHASPHTHTLSPQMGKAHGILCMHAVTQSHLTEPHHHASTAPSSYSYS